jgi:glucosyl-3-phosphoglycerate synthase
MLPAVSAATSPTRTFAHREFPLARLLQAREASVSVCLPARDEAATIAPILETLGALRKAELIDQVVVVDHSRDGTAEIARGLGAEVHDQDDLLPELGPAEGKGDAMWRALSVLHGEVICYLDADTTDFGAHFITGLLGPLLCHPEISLVKAFYRRPFRSAGHTSEDGGGRVTELTARPLLNLFYPELAGFRQPLAGELAARRSLLAELPFTTGYGVDIGLLIDAYRAAGPDALAQVDLDTRQNSHQSLRELGPMAFAVLRAVTDRLTAEGRLHGPLPDDYLPAGSQEAVDLAARQRPPMAELASSG